MITRPELTCCSSLFQGDALQLFSFLLLPCSQSKVLACQAPLLRPNDLWPWSAASLLSRRHRRAIVRWMLPGPLPCSNGKRSPLRAFTAPDSRDIASGTLVHNWRTFRSKSPFIKPSFCASPFPPFESSICTEKKVYPTLPAPCLGSCCSSHHGPCSTPNWSIPPPPKVAEFQQSISTDQVDFGSPAAVYIRSSGRFDTATHRNLLTFGK